MRTKLAHRQRRRCSVGQRPSPTVGRNGGGLGTQVQPASLPLSHCGMSTRVRVESQQMLIPQDRLQPLLSAHVDDRKGYSVRCRSRAVAEVGEPRRHIGVLDRSERGCRRLRNGNGVWAGCIRSSLSLRWKLASDLADRYCMVSNRRQQRPRHPGDVARPRDHTPCTRADDPHVDWSRARPWHPH